MGLENPRSTARRVLTCSSVGLCSESAIGPNLVLHSHSLAEIDSCSQDVVVQN